MVTRKVGFEFNIAICLANTKLLRGVYGQMVPSYWYDSLSDEVWYRDGDLEKLGARLTSIAREDSSFIVKDLGRYHLAKSHLLSSARKISKLNLAEMTNYELGKSFLGFEKYYQSFYVFLAPSHGVDRYALARLGDEALKTRVKVIDRERQAAMKIATYFGHYGWDRRAKKQLEIHWGKYCWLSCWDLGTQPLSKEYFRKEIEGLKKRPKRVLNLKAKIKDKVLVNLLRCHIALRTERKNVLCQTHYLIWPTVIELGKRLGLGPNECLLLSFREMAAALIGRITKKYYLALVKGREDGWATYQDGGRLNVITNENIARMRDVLGFRVEETQGARKVFGRVASQGLVTGPAKIVLTLNELSKVKKGDILIAHMTTPDYVLAMNRCIGIITDEGGATCHAAIVSRELGVACVTGTRIATQVFKDGDMVKLDAINGSAEVIRNV